jgi:hypothetical protein
MSRQFWYPGNNAPAVSGFDGETHFRLVANGTINTGTNTLVDGATTVFDAQQIGVGNGAVDPVTGEITNGGITSNLQVVGSNGANFLLSLENLTPGGLIAGDYTWTNLTVDIFGRITAAQDGNLFIAADGGGGGALCNQTVGLEILGGKGGGAVGLQGINSAITAVGPVTNNAITVTLDEMPGLVAGVYPDATVSVDTQGRIYAITGGGGGGFTFSIDADAGGPEVIATGATIDFSGSNDISTTLSGAFPNYTVTIDSTYVWSIRADSGGTFSIDGGDTVDIEGGINCDTSGTAVGATKTTAINVQASGGVGAVQYSDGAGPPRLRGTKGWLYNDQTLATGGLQGGVPLGNGGWGGGAAGNNTNTLVHSVPFYTDMQGKSTPVSPLNFPSQYYGCSLSDWTLVDSRNIAEWRCDQATLLNNINKPYDAEIKLVTVGPNGSTCGCIQTIVEPATAGGPILVQDWNLAVVGENLLGAAPFGVALNTAGPGRTVACVTRGICSVYWGAGSDAPAGSLVQVTLAAGGASVGTCTVGATAIANTPYIGVSIDGQSGLTGPVRSNTILVWVRISMFESF